MKNRASTVAAALLLAVTASAAPPDPATIERLTGLKGTMNTNEEVFKVTAPRNDLKIAVDGWTMPPFMGLTSWAAFSEGQKAGAMVMGDLVLFQDEVNPVMSALLDNGVGVTALHNHFFYDEPKVYFMHIAGEGTVEKLATGVRKAFDAIKGIRTANPQPASKFSGAAMAAQNSITGKAIEDILGVKGQGKDGMFKVVIGRTAKMVCGCEIAKEMGVNTWAAFAGTDDNALVDGDFAMTEDELQPVLKSLRAQGVNIVAIHHHMTHEKPRYLFLHYWGRGTAVGLARALKTARGEQTKAAAAAARAQGGFKEIPAADFEQRRAAGRAVVLDVRSAEEFAKGHVPGAVNIDINAPGFARSVAQFDKSQTILVNCHAGSRGAIASAELAKLGFKSVCNLEGGLEAWEKSGNKPQGQALIWCR